MSIKVPKKFYRNVIRGVSYYSQEKKRVCKLDELVAYVYLKNFRSLPANRVESIVEKALADLCTTGVIEKIRNNYRLTEKLVCNWPEDQPERAGPSGSGRTKKRKASTRTKRSAKSRKHSRTSMRPAVDAMNVADDNQEEGSDEEEEEDYDSEEEVLPHRPLKIEMENTEDRQVPVVTTPAAASTSEPENETVQGSSPTEGSSA
ncbi:uncharacterized protein LOC135704985 [Ochlerotatus camptorhynchus]|uniref:uncharacterized protein LOC135704985 n=1 Tax=Ochlerotatus camptorhynchus TaxID=644619 RepID=UPI0031D7BF67